MLSRDLFFILENSLWLIAASSFCHYWWCSVLVWCQSWYLFCEAATEKAPEVTMANEEPQEGVKTEDHDHINMKVVRQDGSVVQFEIWRRNHFWRKPIVNDRVCPWGRSDSDSMGSQSMKQTHLHSWKWKMKIQLLCPNSRQEVSTKERTCCFTPEPRSHSKLENHDLVPPHRDCCSTVFSSLSFSPPPLLCCTLSNGGMCTSILIFFN